MGGSVVSEGVVWWGGYSVLGGSLFILAWTDGRFEGETDVLL